MEIQIIDNGGTIVARYPGAGIISFDGGQSYFCSGNGNPQSLGITFPGGMPGCFINCNNPPPGTLFITQNGGATWTMVI
jgi:hypothetical protein